MYVLRIHGRDVRVEKHLPAVVEEFWFDFEAQSYKYTEVREPSLGNASLCLFELLPNIWDCLNTQFANPTKVQLF